MTRPSLVRLYATSLRTLAIAACLGVPAFAQSKTLLTVSRYDSQSIDATAGVLSTLRPFDILMVTPGTGATASPWIPGAGLSAMIGDPDKDGVLAEFASLPQDSFGVGDLFVKYADRKKGDPRSVYWTVRVRSVSATAPKIEVFTKSGTHTMQVGDWVRIGENGIAELFITQALIMKAAGTQTGAWVPGADCLCQAADGSLYYSPPNGPTQTNSGIAGGHWVSNGTTAQWLNDGSIAYIPAKAITYDKNGNVSDVTAGSARAVVGEVTTGTNAGTPNVRSMCVNSGAVDSIGKQTSISFYMTGLEIDPNGGSFPGPWGTTMHPNLIFTFGNPATSCCGGPFGSWMGTVFSTAKNSTNQLGSIAKINGVVMGTTSGKADGAWTGIKGGTGHASAPLLRGLALVEAGFQTTAPYGSTVLGTAMDGLIDTKKDPNVRLMYQGPGKLFPAILLLGIGPSTGGQPFSVDLSSLFAGFGSVYALNGLVSLSIGVTDLNGRKAVTVPVPNDPRLIGATLVWQALGLNPGHPLSNPVINEIR